MMYCTQKQIAYLIGSQHMATWKTIRDRIDHLNRHAKPNRRINYHLRSNPITGPFDIQVHYDDLPPGHKGYIAYREERGAKCAITTKWSKQ